MCEHIMKSFISNFDMINMGIKMGGQGQQAHFKTDLWGQKQNFMSQKLKSLYVNWPSNDINI